MGKRNGNSLLLPLFAVVVVLSVVAGCSGSATTDTRTHIAPRDSTAPYDGIDISSHQGNIDWDKVASDPYIRFVYIKATEGATYQSEHYSRNVRGAHRHGILVGSYHYVTSTSPIDAQAQNFTSQATKQTQDLIPMIDVEDRGAWSRSQLIDSVAKLASLLERHYGRKPMIYSTIDFYNKNLAPHFTLAATRRRLPPSTGRADTPCGSLPRMALSRALTPMWTCATTDPMAGSTKSCCSRKMDNGKLNNG